MTIDGTNKLHLFVTIIAGLFGLYMIMFGDFQTRVTGFLILLADIIFLGKFYEKL
ncbi:MAG: hypothetical protein HYT71_00670 [Candidatus Aenigmarchaeota archaeon]|nr:hypothetical protein [Candidatus Aenigmarchaeota archaeon]